MKDHEMHVVSRPELEYNRIKVGMLDSNKKAAGS